jgi:hypothetical protein
VPRLFEVPQNAPEGQFRVRLTSFHCGMRRRPLPDPQKPREPFCAHASPQHAPKQGHQPCTGPSDAHTHAKHRFSARDQEAIILAQNPPKNHAPGKSMKTMPARGTPQRSKKPLPFKGTPKVHSKKE